MEEEDQSPAQSEETASEPTMESLLQEQATFQERLKAREVVWVKMVQSQEGSILVDIGEKREGVIAVAEFEPRSLPAAGSRIPAVLVSPARDNKPAILSFKKARQQLGWDQARKAFEEKARVRGTVVSSVKGGFIVDVAGVGAFLPASLADLRPVRKPQAMIGTGVRCYIIEMHADKKQLVVSRKAVLEEEVKKRREKLLAALKAGEVRIGRVTRVAAATGAFVDLGGLEGFLGAGDAAWKEPEKALAALTPGHKLRVKILRIDSQSGKVALGAKQLLPNPADALRKKYPAKAVVRATVAEVRPEGARIQLSDGTAAFCAASELAQKEPPAAARGQSERSPREENNPVWPAVGEAVSAIVLGIRPDTFEVSVSIRRFEEIQDRKRMAQYLKGSPKLTLGQILTSGSGEEP